MNRTEYCGNILISLVGVGALKQVMKAFHVLFGPGPIGLL